jgi:hypothetical protein
MSYCVAGITFVVTIAGCITAASCGPQAGNNGCLTRTDALAHNASGDSVDEKTAICGGIAFSSIESLVLRRHNTDRSTVFFRYDDSGAEPHVSWVNENKLDIYIFQTGDTYVMLNNIDNVNISYRIGTGYETLMHLYSQCMSHTVAGMQWCLQYIAAVMAENSDDELRDRICVPQGTPLQRSVELTEEWIRAHPEEKTMPAASVVKRGLTAAYPCK